MVALIEHQRPRPMSPPARSPPPVGCRRSSNACWSRLQQDSPAGTVGIGSAADDGKRLMPRQDAHRRGKATPHTSRCRPVRLMKTVPSHAAAHCACTAALGNQHLTRRPSRRAACADHRLARTRRQHQIGTVVAGSDVGVERANACCWVYPPVAGRARDSRSR